jgi:hypothetical protein
MPLDYFSYLELNFHKGHPFDCLGLNFVQTTWHVEWLLDLLILWALSNMSEIESAENMLESLRSRLDI